MRVQDAAFRATVAALLGRLDESEAGGDISQDGASAAGALRYTRDRICCPRDMGVGAAAQLRAHLNQVAGEKLGADH